MRQRGVTVSFAAEEGETDAGEVKEVGTGNRAPQRTYVSPIGPKGERFAIVSVNRRGDSAHEVLYVAIRDREGLAMFEYGAMSIRQEQELLMSWKGEEPLGFQEVSPEWAWEVLRRAYARSREVASLVPEEFVLFRHQWELHGDDASQISMGLDLEGDASAREMAVLARSYPMKMWGVDQDLVAECAGELEEVESSPLTLGPELARGRREKVFAKFAEFFFDEENRRFWRQRLEETARFLAAACRDQEAVAALATAKLMRDSIASNPFCLETIRSRVEATKKRDESEQKLIERPGAARLPPGGLA